MGLLLLPLSVRCGFSDFRVSVSVSWAGLLLSGCMSTVLEWVAVFKDSVCVQKVGLQYSSSLHLFQRMGLQKFEFMSVSEYGVTEV